MQRSSESQSRAKGFSLIETLIAVGVVLTLVATLLPAVNHSRDAARRTHCTNNLRQMSGAVLCYESMHSVLPRGVSGVPREFGVEARLFDCPSTPRKNTEKYDYGETARLTIDPTADDEIRVVPGAWYVTPKPTGKRAPASLLRVADGTFKTLLLCESAGAPHVYQGRPRNHPLGPWPSHIRTGIHGLIKTNTVQYRHHQKGSGHFEYSGMDINRTNLDGIYSFHAAGANTAMCDGSVRFQHGGVEADAMARMFSRNDEDL